ncbi:TonB-dependent receptor [Pontibacter sp. G13]|uniref:TonB-dependent receptor n=1 Tax=Pontibacter sp. G13 TaxID=3074898 RepID=UPI00288BE55D|nr:TonB-dependent receptor [Pontibacter sp. G13]WNJ20011.1 TonB-dependent receptor [Pontibacter sp. G13]
MKSILLTLSICLAALSLSAQSALEISLMDSLYQPVVEEQIVVTNQDIGFSTTKFSNSQGKIRLDGLPTSGTYDIQSIPDGRYQTIRVQDIRLISGQPTSITLKLQPALVQLEEVMISAGSSITLNRVNAEVAAELSQSEIEALPIEGRDITRALYRLPNITQATGFYPEAPNIAINGANALYTNYQIDGMENNENFLGGQRFAMPVGFVQNITALTNNFSAEYGLTSNGIINLTTRSGSNEPEGEVFFVTRPGPAIDAPSRFAQRDLSGNQVKDGFQRYQGGFGIGGALVKNRTFYYLNAEYTIDYKDNLLNVPQLGINETVPGTNQFTYVSAKIDHHWTRNLRSSLRVNSGFVGIERQGGGLEGGVSFPSAGNTQDRNSLNIALQNTYTGNQFIWEGNYQFGRFRWNYAEPFNQTHPNVTVEDPSGMTMALLGHPGYVFDETEEAHILQQKLTFYLGRHTLKAGGQMRSSGFSLFGGGNPNGSYTVRLTQPQLDALRESGIGADLAPSDLPEDVQVLNYATELHPTSFDARQQIFSLYVEDQIAIDGRLNLNLGLRYDYDGLSKGGGSQGDLDNIAPRISANYQLTDRTSVRAGYGMYYDKILYAIYSDALQQSTQSADYLAQLQALIDAGQLPADTDLEAITNNGNLAANVSDVAYLQGPSADELQDQRAAAFSNERRILNPNGYANPFSHQFMLGLQHQVNSKTLLSVDLMHNRSYNLFRLRELNAPAAYPVDPDNVVVRTQAEADLTRPVPIMSDAQGPYALVAGDTLRGISRNVIMTESGGRSNFYAATVTLQKDRGADPFAYRVMYTLSYLENNTEDINFRAMDANDFEAEWGPSINDRTHLIQGYFSYFPVKNLTFTLAALLQSGQPINRVPDAQIYGTTDLNGDGRSFGDAYVGNSDRQPGETRNSDRLPWSNTFDVSAFYRIPFGPEQFMEIGAQVFNLFNAENLSGYSNNATQSNQIQTGPTSSGVLVRRNAAPPRQFQFSVRYLF